LGLQLRLLIVQLLKLSPELVNPIRAVLDLLLDLYNLIVELLKQSIVLSLLLLGLLQLEQLIGQLFLQGPGLLHELLLLLHILNQRLMQVQELFFGLVSPTNSNKCVSYMFYSNNTKEIME
jgi:hypothetical protein